MGVMPFIKRSLRNRLWQDEKNSDVKVTHADGSTEIVPLASIPKPQPTIDQQEVINERNNERYYEWRSAILKRDQRTCVLCGDKKWIQVHHITRWADDKAKRYDLQNGVCLCIPCHLKHHGSDMQPFPKEITDELQAYIGTLYIEIETSGCADKSIPAH